MGGGGSGGRSEGRGGAAPPHGGRLDHLLPELADGSLQFLPRLPLPTQLLLKLLAVELGPLQTLAQVRQLGATEGTGQQECPGGGGVPCVRTCAVQWTCCCLCVSLCASVRTCAV